MRTSIKNLFVATLALVTIGTSAFATDIDTKNVTVLKQVKNTNKIVVNGNVEVILIQAPTESVKIYDSYYSKNALVQQENGILRISSFQKETLVVAVYVRNLSAIEASGNATVKTQGQVNFLTLAVILNDNATAAINTKTVNLYTSVKGNATLKLSGNTEEYFAMISSGAKLNMDQFYAQSSSVNASNPVMARVKSPKVYTLPVDDTLPELSK